MSTLLDEIKNMKYSQREVDFILYNWSLIDGEVDCPNNLEYLKSFFKYCLDEKKQTIDPTFLQKERFLIGDEAISWFKDDLRAGLFLYAFIHFRYNNLSLYLQIYDDFLKDLVMSIDCFHEKNYGLNTSYVSKLFSSRTKRLILRQAFHAYKNYKNKPKDLNWLNRNDKDQLDWAIEYLQELGLLIQPLNFLSANQKDSYTQICASIDALDLHPDLGSKITDKIKNKRSTCVNGHDGHMYIQKEQCLVPVIGQNLLSNNDWFINQHGNPAKSIKQDNLPKLAFNSLDPFHTGPKSSEHKDKILSNMRNAWNQKVFRDKKPVKLEKQLKLPHGYNKKLGKIAEVYNVNLVNCLKHILDKEYNDVISKK